MRTLSQDVLEAARLAADNAVHETFTKNPGNYVYGSAAHDYWRIVFEAAVSAHIQADRIEKGVY